MQDKAGVTKADEAEAVIEVEVDAAAGQDVDPGTDAGAADTAATTTAGAAPEPAEGAGGEADEVVVSFGEPSPGSDEVPEETETFRELRRLARERQKENQQLRQELEATRSGARPKAEPLGQKPTLESCEYDTDRFEAALSDWHTRKRAQEQEAETQRQQQEAQQQAFNQRVQVYGQQKAALKVRDYDDAESAVAEALTGAQQAILLTGAEAPAQLVYALGKSPEKLKELKAIQDPVKFAFAVAKLETQVKVTPRKAPPAPERRVTAGAPIRSSEQSLAKLEAEAERTGDRSKVIAYKRQLRAKQQ